MPTFPSPGDNNQKEFNAYEWHWGASYQKKTQTQSNLVTELGESHQENNPFHLTLTRPDSSPTHPFPQIFTYLASSPGTQWALASCNEDDILLKNAYHSNVYSLLFWEQQTSGRGCEMAIYRVPRASFRCRVLLLLLRSLSLSQRGRHNPACTKVTIKGGRAQPSQVPEEDTPAFLPLQVKKLLAALLSTPEPKPLSLQP